MTLSKWWINWIVQVSSSKFPRIESDVCPATEFVQFVPDCLHNAERKLLKCWWSRMEILCTTFFPLLSDVCNWNFNYKSDCCSSDVTNCNIFQLVWNSRLPVFRHCHVNWATSNYPFAMHRGSVQNLFDWIHSKSWIFINLSPP